ncbi:hypothetical protein P7K49_039822 [Saguinus oedipus]|uniref:Uncharacterized protein n=1 Tax=Saguinus oedipus TaxID=9490 RepID=A0ABQ9TC83_SAGOE|nr:hypothetical protein P7K49_039822 [Saguinus oedipus]
MSNGVVCDKDKIKLKALIPLWAGAVSRQRGICFLPSMPPAPKTPVSLPGVVEVPGAPLYRAPARQGGRVLGSGLGLGGPGVTPGAALQVPTGDQGLRVAVGGYRPLPRCPGH